MTTIQRISTQDLNAILESHKRWLMDEGGERTNLRGAYLRDADLRGANLSGADLRDANLRGAHLWNATGERRHLKSGQIEQYSFAYTAEYLQIGCECHAIADWWSFDDARIAAMDDGALEFWKKWKLWFQQLIEMSPAEPTKAEERGSV